jgi:3-hydroxyacyl-CoA dehydrogenase / enoyl-CoA hydratase / 3-hydroxybutyryl-CoA epimerase
MNQNLYQHLETSFINGTFTITFNQKDSKVNTLCEPVLVEFEKVLDDVSCKTDVKAVVFRSAKEGVFIAGADINEIKNITTPQDARIKVSRGQQIISKIEKLSTCPQRGLKCITFAVINGACMGGGLELALACNYRICIEGEKTKLALPEVNLGIIPGFGGCIRLPKVVGLLNALPIILTGAPIDSKKAFKIGLANFVASGMEAEKLVSDFIQKTTQARKIPKHKLYFFQRYLKHFMVSKARKQIMQTTKGFYPAPLAAAKLLEQTFCIAYNQDKALKMELDAFCTLAVGQISKNLIDLYFSTETLKKNNFGIDDDVNEKVIEEVSVLGAGVMGGGIAWLFSKINLPIKMKDINLKAIGLGYMQIAKIYESLLKKRKIKPAELAQKYNLIGHTLENSDLKASNLVIEAVVEDINIKKAVLTDIEKHISKDAIIATNTSSLLVDEIAQGLEHKHRFVGMHFFNPVNKMPLVEVVRGKGSSPQAVKTVLNIARKSGKVAIVVGDCAGFVVNRILLPYMNEALKCLEEYGPQHLKAIDKIFTNFGMPMGPFTLADEVGLDVCYKVSKNLHHAYGERAKSAKTIESLFVEQKLLGKKGGKGFYNYNNDGKQLGLNAEAKLTNPTQPKQFNETEILNRCLQVMINEAKLILAENIIDSEQNLDIAMIMGCGFPAFRGGLVKYAKLNGKW